MASDFPRFRLLPTVLLLTTLGTAMLAGQEPGGGPPGERMGPPSGMGRRPPFDPVVLEGPPAPEGVDTLLGLNAGQHERYATLYQNLMNSTRSEREQLRARREAMRNGPPADREGMQQSRGAMRETMQTLADRQKAFDEALKDFLGKDQLKKYDDWREQRRKEGRERFRQGGGGPPA